MKLAGLALILACVAALTLICWTSRPRARRIGESADLVTRVRKAGLP